ncbi:hypothetical protein G4Y79_22730 [Phototrophicus methaneseepsis]|uniref:Uncharacterized protein n=1 Tax=Phototrophicus methaneseepsis TaxID=2710758 RepID=A0A7S8IED6_9CHLR|nr:hypothetical protein G4Y79_22730 [Phototrophicus methaneseepsis]
MLGNAGINLAQSIGNGVNNFVNNICKPVIQAGQELISESLQSYPGGLGSSLDAYWSTSDGYYLYRARQESQSAANSQSNTISANPTPNGGVVITCRNIGFDTSISDIMKNGVKEVTGGSSNGTDNKFYAVTTQRSIAPYTPPTFDQASEMLSGIFTQLAGRRELARNGYSNEPVSDFAQVVQTNIPESVVRLLEESKFLQYGPFYGPGQFTPNSGWTESIFFEESFPIINQYRYFWITSNKIPF